MTGSLKNYFIAAACMAILGLGVSLTALRFSPDPQSTQPKSIEQADPPIYGWWVCNDLGIGPVPGVPGARQRMTLCHKSGWRIKAFCLEPGMEMPPTGTTCSLLEDGETFWCGDAYQRLRTYEEQAPPSPPDVPQQPSPSPTPTQSPTNTPTSSPTPSLTATPTATATSTPTATPIPPTETPTVSPSPSSTPTPTGTIPATPDTPSSTPPGETPPGPDTPPTGTPTPRPRPGGLNYWFAEAATPAPTFPAPPLNTPTPSLAQADPASPTAGSLTYLETSSPLAGIDFSKGLTNRLELNAIQPVDGVPVPLSVDFTTSSTCGIGEHLACVHSIDPETLPPTTLISMHSGLSGEGEPLRLAFEGNWFGGPLYSLSQVQARLDGLQGSQVIFSQEGAAAREANLVAVVRVPAVWIETYFSGSVANGLDLVASLFPDTLSPLNPESPLLVIETCGWKMPQEPWSPGVSEGSGSVYLLFIQ